MTQTFPQAVDVVAHQSTNERGERMTIAEIAARIGRSENYLRKATSQYDDAHPLRGDLIAPLTLATGNFALVEHIAEACGGVFFRIPRVTADSRDVIETTAAMLRDFSELLAQSAAAWADGRMTIDEASAIAKDGRAVIARVASYVELAEAKAAETAVRR